MSDLEQIVDGVEPEAEVTTPEPQPEPEAQVAPEPEPTPEAVSAPDMVPAAVVGELRREIRELKQAASRPEPQPAPEFIDPEGAQFMQQQAAQMASNLRLDMSEEMARQQHGDAVVDEAFQALQANAQPAQIQAILSSRSPWIEVVKWHQQAKVAQEIGNDPVAYRAKVEAEVRAKIEAEMVAEQAKAAAAQAAPSMANVTGTGGGPKTTWAGPTPLDNLLGS